MSTGPGLPQAAIANACLITSGIWLASLTRNVAFALAGIFFYTGVLVGDLKIENKLDNCLPHCYIGGNGSKLLDWVDNGNYTPNSQFRDVFAMCLAAGAYIRTQDITEDDVIRLQIKKVLVLRLRWPMAWFANLP